MNINEKINKMNELLAEVNKLAEEINKEHNVPSSTTTDEALKVYIQDAQDTDIQNYWINVHGEVVSGVGEYLPNDFNPYCNYMRKDYADKSAKLKKFYDILLAFKWSNEKNYKPDWANTENKYYIYYDVKESKYDIDFVYDMVECIVYFESSEIATKCAEFLTNIDPEGELIK